jgi:uncharacterized membrane protein
MIIFPFPINYYPWNYSMNMMASQFFLNNQQMQMPFYIPMLNNIQNQSINWTHWLLYFLFNIDVIYSYHGNWWCYILFTLLLILFYAYYKLSGFKKLLKDKTTNEFKKSYCKRGISNLRRIESFGCMLAKSMQQLNLFSLLLYLETVFYIEFYNK